MKSIIKYIGLLFAGSLLWQACQNENLDFPAPALPQTTPEKVTFALIPTLKPDVLQETEILPMTRAKNLIRTRLLNHFQAVIIKKTDNKWIVDTLITGKIDPAISDFYFRAIINVYDSVSLPALRLDLRPGTYKAGFFLNANNQDWNPNIQPGYVVSEKEDITPEDDLPVAYTYKIQEDPHFYNYKYTMLTEEPFAGWTSFTIGKNDTLEQTGSLPSQQLTLERRATRFRYLLKDTTVIARLEGYEFPLSFVTTPHFLRANLKVPQETPFCQGLNILGGGYYPRDSVCTSLGLYISTSGDWYSSPVNNRNYLMVIPENSTYRSYYILMDEYYPEGVDGKIENIYISANSGGLQYIYEGSISRKFRLNHLSGVIFEPSPREAAVPNGLESTFYLEEDTDADAVKLFDPYFELNPKKPL